MPSAGALQRYAEAVGCEREIELVARSGRPMSECSYSSSSCHGWLRARPSNIVYASPSGQTPSPVVRAALQSCSSNVATETRSPTMSCQNNAVAR